MKHRIGKQMVFVLEPLKESVRPAEDPDEVRSARIRAAMKRYLEKEVRRERK